VRYLVTGGAGFVGSHLIDRILQDETTTAVVLDDLSNTDGRWLEPHRGDERLEVVQEDLCDSSCLDLLMEGVDRVVHLAAGVDMRRGLRDTGSDVESGIKGTRSVLDAMVHTGVANIVFASSCAVYGEAVVVPTSEHDGPLSPISLYGASKVASEALLSAYAHLHGLNSYALRFGNVVGDRMNHGIVLNFIAKLKEDPTRLLVLGDGTQTRSYVLVEDCVEAIVRLPAALGSGSHIVNVSSEDSISAFEVSEIVVEELGLSEVQIEFSGEGKRGWPGDVSLVHLDCERARRAGWYASTNSEGAARETVRRLLGMWEQLPEAPLTAFSRESARGEPHHNV
jgi:UDP-glucose 4-epimerase